MSKKLLFCHGEGLGNVMLSISTIRTLKEVLGYDIDFWHAFGSFNIPKIIPYVDKWYVGPGLKNANLKIYDGKVSTFWTRQHQTILPIPLLNTIQPLRMDRSEADIYMDIARDLGVQEEAILWHGECLYNKVPQKYDVVLMNGYNPVGSANWKIKSYPHYTEVAEKLKDMGLTVCSIGKKHEYIKGTVDETGRELLDSLGVVKRGRVLVSTDTGMYHCANALGVRNIAIFTATSIDKNYDERFHKYTTILGRDDLECRPCQAKRRWTKDCTGWECRDVDPDLIVKTVMEMI